MPLVLAAGVRVSHAKGGEAGESEHKWWSIGFGVEGFVGAIGPGVNIPLSIYNSCSSLPGSRSRPPKWNTVCQVTPVPSFVNLKK